MRFFVEIGYLGTEYAGWQRQPNAVTVQEVVEHSLATLLQVEVPIVGCGRTDSGVHASCYFFHFDTDRGLESGFLKKLDDFLPKDITAYKLIEVPDQVHARYDAISRTYEYIIALRKDPFSLGQSFYYPQGRNYDKQKLLDAADLICGYDEFYPFCKSNSDVKTMHCKILESRWELSDHMLSFNITANRFLRGMVRLIVGMALNVSMGKIALSSVKASLDSQESLNKSWSVPAQGLFLRNVEYPFLRH